MNKRYRSAVTGEYVTEAEAKADPERTVGESDGRDYMRLIIDAVLANPGQMSQAMAKAFPATKMQDRLADLEARVAALEAKAAE